MATTGAIDAVCSAIVHILRSSMLEQLDELRFTEIAPTFSVYQTNDFSDPQSSRHVTSGASVFLYRALPNLSHRSPSGNSYPNGEQQYNQLPLDLYLLVTIWGNSPSTQNKLVGWVMRTLEDYPLIPASILNIESNPPAFESHEAVELLLSEMDGEELLQLWDMLGDGQINYQITIPYLVRSLMLESSRRLSLEELIQTRTFELRRVEREGV